MRPEEERSLSEAIPEIQLPPQGDQSGPMQWATVLVGRWENELGWITALPTTPQQIYAHIILSSDVKDRMRDDIVALINDVITREHNTP